MRDWALLCLISRCPTLPTQRNERVPSLWSSFPHHETPDEPLQHTPTRRVAEVGRNFVKPNQPTLKQWSDVLPSQHDEASGCRPCVRLSTPRGARRTTTTHPHLRHPWDWTEPKQANRKPANQPISPTLHLPVATKRVCAVPVVVYPHPETPDDRYSPPVTSLRLHWALSSQPVDRPFNQPAFVKLNSQPNDRPAWRSTSYR